MAILNKVTAGKVAAAAVVARRHHDFNAASCCGLGSVMSVEAKCVQLELGVISRRP